ncbi:cyclin-T1-5-like [Lotus japonicus]|uniref:cyclin-T1-5-like n=1 Tax=Lotus japonicus TaxID=34305 RepID=UPI00258C7A88|nr:cyclin-T1-5-like [Lotus japonicus]
MEDDTIGTACLSIATKDEDKPGSLWSVIVFSYSLNYPHNPEEAMKQIYESQEIFNSRKELIILAEKLVLATLNFTFEIPHPHDFLTAYVTTLAIEPVESKNKLIRVASEFANDGNLTTLSLQFCPQQIAGVCIFLAVKLLKLELQDGSESFWRNMIGVTQQQLEAICNQLLRIYVIFRKRRGLEENAGDGGGARADAEAPATNEAQAREPNPSSKGKEVVGSASGAGDGDGTSAAGDGDLASAAGDGDLASVAAETLVLLLHHARAVQQARAVQRVQADEPNPSSSKREEQVEGSSSPAATNALVLLGVTPKHSSSSEE